MFCFWLGLGIQIVGSGAILILIPTSVQCVWMYWLRVGMKMAALNVFVLTGLLEAFQIMVWKDNACALMYYDYA